MSKAHKKLVRERFRDSVFSRDRYQCVLCTRGEKVAPVKPHLLNDADWKESMRATLDAHHITDRNDMPAGGYVKTNGITVCKEHHEEVEAGLPEAEELYMMVGSSYEIALEDAKREERRNS